MDHAYYLDQMGIERWVRRTVSQGVNPVVLLVICKENRIGPFEGRTQILFNQMLGCIGLDPSQVHYTSEQGWLKACSLRNPRALLAMTDLQEETISCNIPIVFTQHPHDLLENPYNKKQVYQDLLQLMHHLR